MYRNKTEVWGIRFPGGVTSTWAGISFMQTLPPDADQSMALLLSVYSRLFGQFDSVSLPTIRTLSVSPFASYEGLQLAIYNFSYSDNHLLY